MHAYLKACTSGSTLYLAARQWKEDMVIITRNNQHLIRSLFGFRYSIKHYHVCFITWVSVLWPWNNTVFSSWGLMSFYNAVDHWSPWRYIFTGERYCTESGSSLFCFGLCLPGLDVSLMGHRRPRERWWKSNVIRSIDVHANVTLM